MINLDRLVTWLNQAQLQRNNPPLYQVILTLIKAAQEFQNEQDVINAATSGSVTGFENQHYLTHQNDLVTLPNSRQLIAGTNVIFDDTVVGQRTINVPGSAVDHVVMSDGNTPIPSPMDDGNGNFIYITYTP